MTVNQSSTVKGDMCELLMKLNILSKPFVINQEVDGGLIWPYLTYLSM
jgi:hypothetical protein